MKCFTVAVMILLCISTACTQQSDKSFTIKGTVKNAEGKTLRLIQYAPGFPTIDSVILPQNGNFTLHIKASEDNLYYLSFDPTRGNFFIQKPVPGCTFINDSSIITINGDIAINPSFSAKGGQASSSLYTLEEELNPLLEKRLKSSLREDSFKTTLTDHDVLKHHQKESARLEDDIDKTILAYYNKFENPAFKLYVINTLIWQGNYTYADSLYKNAINQYPNYKILPWSKNMYDDLKNNLDNYSKETLTAYDPFHPVGTQLPSFSLANDKGDTINITKNKGKYLLLHFWSVDDIDSRKENTFLKDAFNQLSDEKFTIISVCLSENKREWLEAIEKDKLKWINIIDTNYTYYGNTYVTFRIDKLPFNILVDPKGIVIGAQLHGKELMGSLQKFIRH